MVKNTGTEELAHLEMVGTLIHQLTKNATTTEIENSPMAPYFIDHGKGVYAISSGGNPFKAETFSVTGDPIADLVENLAAEQKARATYDNILRVSDDPDVNDVIKFLREREVVHFQRFGEPLKVKTKEKSHNQAVFRHFLRMFHSGGVGKFANTL